MKNTDYTKLECELQKMPEFVKTALPNVISKTIIADALLISKTTA